MIRILNQVCEPLHSYTWHSVGSSIKSFMSQIINGIVFFKREVYFYTGIYVIFWVYVHVICTALSFVKWIQIFRSIFPYSLCWLNHHYNVYSWRMTGRKASSLAHPFEQNLGTCWPLDETWNVILTVQAHSPEACGAGPLQAAAAPAFLAIPALCSFLPHSSSQHYHLRWLVTYYI